MPNSDQTREMPAAPASPAVVYKNGPLQWVTFVLALFSFAGFWLLYFAIQRYIEESTSKMEVVVDKLNGKTGGKPELDTEFSPLGGLLNGWGDAFSGFFGFLWGPWTLVVVLLIAVVLLAARAYGRRTTNA